MKGFEKRVRAIVAAIPRGRVLTYREVAQRAGNGKAARAVGNIMAANRDPAIPCHRIVRSDASVGGFNRGITEKIRLLRREGVRVEGDRIVL
ncbi:MAG: 6-O-methylguanine DNA methyltransferase [Candidatus Terrybacteria bacterium RIFCSPLOWO2_01_FULL_58_14]|uniref:6-O-methylguanine DNA methyltransferase n=1 Tax=Candidatus Terrybacteria bacterium RIFCSPLOWO2_01_FULL_58_14 TaxID=1802369 RepID=A0A1G2PY18_9BACT|nr:MAG: 6-O-methylguanine DNA methyltransferase [Candidatus Terrybacteria bacterium RIFCSPLOWO2_01_FULL_58_14]